MTGSGTREETQHTLSYQQSWTPHHVKAGRRAAAKDPRIRNYLFSDLWWDPERLLQVSYKNMYIVAANELLQKMQNS